MCFRDSCGASYTGNVKAVGIGNDKVTIYSGGEKKEYDNIEDAMKDE
jgi:hypothetical protein